MIFNFLTHKKCIKKLIISDVRRSIVDVRDRILSKKNAINVAMKIHEIESK